jgi:hypothetical protein
MPTQVACDCGKQYAAPDALAGKKVKCPHCGKPLPISAAKNLALGNASPVDLHELLEEVGLTDTGTGHRCPGCRAALPEEAVLCIACGYDVERGRRVTVKKPRTKADREAAAAQRAGNPRRRMPSWLMVGCVLLTIVGILLAISKFW